MCKLKHLYTVLHLIKYTCLWLMLCQIYWDNGNAHTSLEMQVLFVRCFKTTSIWNTCFVPCKTWVRTVLLEESFCETCFVKLDALLNWKICLFGMIYALFPGVCKKKGIFYFYFLLIKSESHCHCSLLFVKTLQHKCNYRTDTAPHLCPIVKSYIWKLLVLCCGVLQVNVFIAFLQPICMHLTAVHYIAVFLWISSLLTAFNIKCFQ